jgi:UDP-N-acetylglucosamine acyltransferase
MIHPTAIVHPHVQLDATVEVGPYAVIDEHVVIGPECVIGPHAHLTGHTRIGSLNRFHAGCVIGDAPQDLKYRGEPTGLSIGDGNIFREHVTVHRSNKITEETTIGSHNFLMAHCHVGHNVQLANHIIIANGVLLAGHVVVNDRVFISGNCLVHQFVRLGTLALMQGGAAISLDLPPYTIARGDNRICGLNLVGLRRAGFTTDQRLRLKRLYHLLFGGRGQLQTSLAQAEREFTNDTERVLLDFVKTSQRGLCHDSRRRTDSES